MKTELLDKLMANRDDLMQSVADLTEAQLSEQAVIGEWSIRDVVGHVAYWEGIIHAHVRESLAQGRPSPMTTDPSEDTINRREAERRRSWPWRRVLAEFENARAALVERVKGLTETELGIQVPSPWWGQQRFFTVGEMIEEDALGHCREHVREIRALRERQAKAANTGG